MPRKIFTRGRLLSSEVQQYLMDQTVMRFATASQRTTELPDPEVGMVTWLDIPGGLEQYTSRERWEPIGALRVTSRGELPTTGALGMEAVDAGGQRWEWRSVNGSEVWTWPREAQGTLTRVDYAPPANVGLAAGVAQLTAMPTNTFDVPPGRRLEVRFSGVISSTAVGTFAFILQAAGAERRLAVPIPIANVATYFDGGWEFDVAAGLAGHRVTINAGPLSGAGTVTMAGGGIDIPHQLVVRDVGATTAGSSRVQL